MLRKSRIGNLVLSIFAAGIVIGISGCAQPESEPPHVHTFSTDWTSDATFHWHAATCEHTAEVSGKAEHQFPEIWKEVTAATESDDGLEERFCEICNYRVTRVIPVLEHKHDIAKEWSTDETKHWHAASCGRAEHNEDVGEHTWNHEDYQYDSVSGKDIRICTVCSYVDAKTHNHTEDSGTVTKAATCTEDGVKTFKCEICGKEMRTEVIPALELTEINKNGWLIKISNVTEGVKFEITKLKTVTSISWASINKLSNGVSEIHEATGVINTPEFLHDIGTSTFVFPFVNPNEHTKLLIKIEADTGVLEEKLYINTSGGMGCPVYTNDWDENNKISVNINKDKMSAVIEKFVMPDFSNVKLQIEPAESMVEIYKYPNWEYFTGDYKNEWDTTYFELADASAKIPIGVSKIWVNYLRAFKIVGNNSYEKYFRNFRVATLFTAVDVSSMYLTPTDMSILRGRKYKTVEQFTLESSLDGEEAYILVKFSDSATGFAGVTSGQLLDFSKVSDIETQWNTIKSNYRGAEFDDYKYTVIMWNPNEETEEIMQKRNCKGLTDLSKIFFIHNDKAYTAIPF